MILAIDLGSTNVKAALFNASLDRIGSSFLATPYLRNDAHCAEMDTVDVQETVVTLIRETCRSAGVGTEAVTSISVTSQAQNFTILDRDGKARLPVISWLDTRSDKQAAELWTAFGSDWHHHCSFSTVSERMQLAHLLWVHQHMPEVLEGDVRLVTLPGLVFDMVAGVNLTDHNLAAMGGVYSLRDQCWRMEALQRCGMISAQMPRLVPVGTSIRVPSRCTALALPREINLVSAGNDQTAGAFGNRCGEGEVVVTLGTALVAYRAAGPVPGPYSASGCWGPYPGGGYYELATSNYGCLALDWAREILMPGSDVGQFDAAVAQALLRHNTCGGSFHPDRTYSLDAWQGDFADPAEKAYAVLKGITLEVQRLVFEVLECPAGARLTIVGGGSHSPVWLQLIASILDCPVAVGSGDSLLGAASMAVASRASECKIGM